MNHADQTTKKGVLLLSGGIDSAAVGYWMQQAGYQVHPVYVDHFHLAPAFEWQAVRKLSHDAGWEKPLRLRFTGCLNLKRHYNKVAGALPRDKRKMWDLVYGGYPARSLWLLSLATVYALQLDADAIGQGIHTSFEIYPEKREIRITPAIPTFDSTFEFLTIFEGLVNMIAARRVVWDDDRRITIETPFFKFKKSEIVAWAKRKKVPLELTYSCFVWFFLSKGLSSRKLEHCGVCPSCRERIQAFRDARIEDPTNYKDRRYTETAAFRTVRKIRR
jgi:7-cyano-7-deazaguanine synthase